MESSDHECEVEEVFEHGKSEVMRLSKRQRNRIRCKSRKVEYKPLRDLKVSEGGKGMFDFEHLDRVDQINPHHMMTGIEVPFDC